jgi:hypothetical protein
VRALTAIGHGAATTGGRLVMVALGVVVGLGVPVGWIWVGSQIQATTAPSWTALAVVHVGMISTLLVIAALFSFLVARDKRRRRSRSRSDWMRGMTEARRTDSIGEVHPLELIIFLAVFIDVIAFLVWFFVFADPGTPVGQG